MVGKWKHARLSLMMMRALGAIRATPGQRGDQYPGKWPTVDALRRRRLVEISPMTEGGGGLVTLTQAGETIHLHRFQMTMHLDGCHWYTTAGRCECGASYTFWAERDLKADPYSAIWMDPDPEEPCSRCQDLQDGARPLVREEVIEPKAQAA